MLHGETIYLFCVFFVLYYKLFLILIYLGFVQAHQDVFGQLVDLIGITSIMEVRKKDLVFKISVCSLYF